MWSTSDTTAALVKARNQGLTLSSVKAGEDTKTGNGAVAPMLESLGAVIPTGVAAAYTTVAVTVHQFALSARAPGDTAQESDDFAALRIAFLLLAAVVAVVLSYRAASAANRSQLTAADLAAPEPTGPESIGRPGAHRDRVLAEPAAAVVAFVGWALASPGTPLAMYLTPSAMQVVPVLISGAAILLLMAIGTELTRQAKTVDAPQTGDYQV